MATFDYLKEQLNEFVKQFKNAKASYEYDELANLHTIEILPQAVFDSEEFTDWECDFLNVLIKQFLVKIYHLYQKMLISE